MFSKPSWINLIICSALCLHSMLSFAQRTSIAFEHFTSDDGLSSPATRLIQDAYGFIWIGTIDGLNRFDGRNFIVYRNEAGDSTSLANNIINALCLDQQGHVWAATNGGACYYDFEDDAFHHLSFPDSLEKIDKHRVHAITADKQQNIWFATRTHLHQWHSGQPLVSVRIPGDELLQIKYLYADDSGKVWIGNNSSIMRYDPSTKSFISTIITSPFVQERKLTATVHPILPYLKDTLFIGSWYGGIQKVFVHGDEIHCIPYVDEHETDQRKHIIRGMSAGPLGTYWIGTYGNGLSVFDTKTSSFIAHYHHDPANPKSLSDDYVTDVFTDQSGIVWVGTDSGLDKFDPFTQQFQSFTIPPFSGEFSVYRIPSAIIEDPQQPEKLFISISGAGVYSYNRHTDDFILHRHDDHVAHSLPDNTVYSLFIDRKGKHWVGMKAGLALADSTYATYSDLIPFPEGPITGIHRIIEDPDGTFWFGTNTNGIFHFNPATNAVIAYQHKDEEANSLPDNRVFCLLQDQDGFIWTGTQNRGLCRLDPRTGMFKYFQHLKGDLQTIPDNGIYDLQLDDQHQLWIATENGLAAMDLSTFRLTQYNTKDGLCNNDVFSITPDKAGHYWLATSNGLSRFDPKNKTFKNYFISDGLPSNRITGSVFNSQDGTLYIGTSGMLTTCRPGMMQINRHIPKVVITNFRVFDQREPIMRDGPDVQPIQLSYKQNMITFDFAALNFTNAILNQYAYRLKGFDDHWIYCGNKQSATFTNLDGGTYTFQVKAANNDGVWNEVGASVQITVNPPFWKTWWFYLLCLIVVSGILYTAYQFRIRQLMRLQQIRLRISRDLHDDIGSTLSSINMISSMAHSRDPGEKKSPELFQTISQASHQAMELMNDIVWSINPKNDRMEMILTRMRQYASEMLEAAQIKFTLDMDESCHDLSLPIEKRKDFYLIFKEAINNLAKYSKAHHARIKLSCQHRTLILQITDDGIGFDPGQISSGNGLKNMTARTQHLKGTISFNTSPGFGTAIEFKMPVTP